MQEQTYRGGGRCPGTWASVPLASPTLRGPPEGPPGHSRHPQALQRLIAAFGGASGFQLKLEVMLKALSKAAGSLQRVCGAHGWIPGMWGQQPIVGRGRAAVCNLGRGWCMAQGHN